jgi:hypothetical protein
MATSFSSREWTRSANFTPRARNLGARMTRHVAVALMLFAIVQIWLVNAALEHGASQLVTIGALVTLLAFAIPFARRMERRWYRLGEQALPSPALTAHFRRDIMWLWTLAVLLPPLWIGPALLLGF